MKLFNIVKKNLLFLIRSKSSSLILVYGPVILIILIGIGFNNMTIKEIRIGTYSSSYSEFSNKFIDAIKENTNFRIERMNDELSCKDGVESNKLQLCIIFPPDMSLKNNVSNNVRFIVDPTRVNIVWLIMDRVSKTLEIQSSQVSLDLTKALIERINYAYKVSNDNKKSLEELKTNLTSIKKKISNDYSSLESLDLEFNPESFPIDEISYDISNISNVISILYTKTSGLATRVSTDTRSIISNAQSIYNAFKDNNETKSYASKASDIKSKAEELKSSADIIASTSESYYNTAKDAMSEITSKAEDIKNKLGVVDVKFKSASMVRDSVVSDLKSNEQALSLSIDSANNIYNKVNSIIQKINEIEVKTPEVIVSPIKTIIEPVLSKMTHLNYLLPSLIVIVIMFMAIMIGSTLIVVDKNSPAKFRNYVSPTDEIVFLISHYITLILFIIVQMVFVFLVLSYAFKINLFAHIWPLLLYVFIISTMFIFVGIIIGVIFNTEETAMSASIVINIVFLLFSGIILPVEALSEKFIVINRYNPFVISDYILKQLILFNKPLPSYISDVRLLIVYSIILVALTIIISKLFKKRFYVHTKHKA